MAIQKEYTLPHNGDVVNYWRIVRLNHLAKNGTEIVLAGFESKDKSDQYGDNALKEVKNFQFEIEKSYFTNGNAYERAYELIKESKLDNEGNETNFFADAIDC
jgi:hypothetical protein